MTITVDILDGDSWGLNSLGNCGFDIGLSGVAVDDVGGLGSTSLAASDVDNGEVETGGFDDSTAAVADHCAGVFHGGEVERA